MSKKHESKLVDALQTVEDTFHHDELAARAGVSGAVAYGFCRQQAALGRFVQVKEGRKTLYRVNDDIEGGKIPASKTSCDLPVNERFECIEKFTTMVANKVTPSFLLTGQGGTGKTFSVMKALKEAGLKDKEDYIVIKGHSSPLGLYKTLYSHSDMLIVFDDCDSIWSDWTSLNILKAALDSYDSRWISWNSMSVERLDDIPQSFEFTGSIIFISNVDISKLQSKPATGAVVTRTITANLTMTNLEILDRMEGIIDYVENGVARHIKKEVIDYLREIADQLNGLSIRTFLQATRIRMGDEFRWKDMVRWTC